MVYVTLESLHGRGSFYVVAKLPNPHIMIFIKAWCASDVGSSINSIYTYTHAHVHTLLWLVSRVWSNVDCTSLTSSIANEDCNTYNNLQ